MNLKKLNERLKNEYEEIVNKEFQWCAKSRIPPYLHFLKKAYEFAHYNEIVAYFDEMDEKDYESDWKELFDKVPDTLKILNHIYRKWLDYNHPEYFNFFTYEGLVDIMKNCLKEGI